MATSRTTGGVSVCTAVAASLLMADLRLTGGVPGHYASFLDSGCISCTLNQVDHYTLHQLTLKYEPGGRGTLERGGAEAVRRFRTIGNSKHNVHRRRDLHPYGENLSMYNTPWTGLSPPRYASRQHHTH